MFDLTIDHLHLVNGGCDTCNLLSAEDMMEIDNTCTPDIYLTNSETKDILQPTVV